MSMQEAMSLAAEVESTPGYLVVAIGRFQILSDLLASPESFPWCLTVIARNGCAETPAKICNRVDWQIYRSATIAGVPRPPLSPKAATKRRDDAHMRQPTLF